MPSVDLPHAFPPEDPPKSKSKRWIVMTDDGVEIKAEAEAVAKVGKKENCDGHDSHGDYGGHEAHDGHDYGDDGDNLRHDVSSEISDDEATSKENAMDVCAPGVGLPAVKADDMPALDVIESEKNTVQQLIASFMKQNLASTVKTMKLSDIVPLDPLSCFDITDSGDEKLSILDLIKTDTQLQAFTGVSSSVLDCLAQLLTLIVPASPYAELSMKQRVIMTLTKLRTNMGFEVLGAFFGVDRHTCGKYFSSTIKLMSLILKPCIYWPTKEENLMSMPKYFQKQSDTVMLLDMVKISLESPNCLKCHSELFTPNNSSSSIKFYTGVAPSGLIIYLSKVYSGMVANKKILEESDLIAKHLLKPKSDAVMVDKELRLDSVWSKNDIKIYHTPHILRGADLLNAKKQVEKAVQKMKMFTILSGKLCTATAPHIDDILTVIAGLINLTSPLISSERLITVKECAC